MATDFINMKLSLKLTIFLIGVFFKNTEAQNASIIKSDFINYTEARYIGGNLKNHFFYATNGKKKYCLKVGLNDLKIQSENEVKFTKSSEVLDKVFVCDSHVFYITYIGFPEQNIMTPNGLVIIESSIGSVNLYKYNLYNNELTAKKVLEIDSNFKKKDMPRTYPKEKLILIAGVYYNYSFTKVFNQSEIDDPGNADKPLHSTFIEKYDNYPLLPKEINEKVPDQAFKVSTVKGDLKIDFEEKTDNKVFLFKKTINRIKIENIFDEESAFYFNISKSKKVIDIYYTVDANKSLHILGKYMEEFEKRVEYGYFTSCYDSNLNQLNSVDYTPLIETTLNHSKMEENQYFGMFFNYLQNSFNYQVIGVKSQHYFFQSFKFNIKMVVNFNQATNGIFILNIDSVGKLRINNIPMDQNSRLLGYYLMKVYVRGDLIYLVYYDHKDNINLSENMQPVNCKLIKESTVLLGVSIDMRTQEMSSKKVLFNCSEYPNIPPTNQKYEYNNGLVTDNVYFSFSEGYIYRFTFE